MVPSYEVYEESQPSGFGSYLNGLHEQKNLMGQLLEQKTCLYINIT